MCRRKGHDSNVVDVESGRCSDATYANLLAPKPENVDIVKIGGDAEKDPDVRPKKLSKTAKRNRKYAEFRKSAKLNETELKKLKRELKEAKEAEAQSREMAENQRKELEEKEKERKRETSSYTRKHSRV